MKNSNPNRVSLCAWCNQDAEAVGGSSIGIFRAVRNRRRRTLCGKASLPAKASYLPNVNVFEKSIVQFTTNATRALS